MPQLAFQAHYELVAIHPFYDGNGGTSGLLMNFVLERFRLPWCILLKEDNTLYYEAYIKGSSKEIKPFFRFDVLAVRKAFGGRKYQSTRAQLNCTKLFTLPEGSRWM